MLSYKSMQPIYGYYVETDLDNLLDDQPVDYSKKYTDQDYYHLCGPGTKSTNKTSSFSSHTPHSQSKHACNDEVKVYCFEGTPVAISSASSFCDLRDVGTANLETPETETLAEPNDKSCFPPSGDTDGRKESYDTKLMNDEEEREKIPSNHVKEKDDLSIKEGKSVTFRNEDDISKASSPLMFSRSSSVCSLNSFEQHSIVDDRSSISAFSTLASGVISPSDLPDSPGEGMSPDSHKARSLKNDISKDVSDNESDNVLELCIKEDLPDQEKTVKKDPELPVNHCMPWSELSVSKDNLQEKKLLKTKDFNSDENDSLIQHCIKLGMPDVAIPESADELVVDTNYLMHSTPFSDEKVTDQEIIKSDDDSEIDESDMLVQQCIKLGMPANVSKPESSSKIFVKAGYEPQTECQIKNGRGYDEIKSDDDSDGDENVLVQRCIQLGMPTKRTKTDVKSPVFPSAQYQPHVMDKQTYRDNCPDGISDNDGDDDDDDDDELLAKCIIAGMPSPKTVSEEQKRQPVSSNRTVNTKSQDKSNPFIAETNDECGRKVFSSQLPQNPVYAPVHNRTTWISNSSFIEVDSMRIYRTEDTPILSPSASLSDLSSLSFSEDKNCHESHLNNSRNSDCSSESEDDELLLQCIRSGMPGAKRAVA